MRNRGACRVVAAVVASLAAIGPFVCADEPAGTPATAWAAEPTSWRVDKDGRRTFSRSTSPAAAALAGR